ncbi:MAG: metallophosphoesterase [Alistipes sp.]|nr:metallophosphoesterase [Alistipes sp.]
MNRISLKNSVLLLAVAMCSVPAAAFSAEGEKELAPVLIVKADDKAEAYTINHGPYLQGVTYDGATVVFTTSHRGFSKVELRRKGSQEVTTHDSRKNGLIMADNTHNVINLLGLEAATEYEYRIVSTKVENFQPYKVTFGEKIASPWYSFRTFDPKAKEFTFGVLNDIHDDSKKCNDLLNLLPVEELGMVFYNGDILSHYTEEGQPFTSFIDVSVEQFAKHKPFAVVRGNHETRGHLARTYEEFIHNTRDEKYYGVYYFGDTAVVMLDCGEDKLDTHEVYAGFVAFDEYRLEQVEWLKQVIKSKEFRKAKKRIILLHIPPAVEAMKVQGEKDVESMLAWRGNEHWGEILFPVLAKTKIDVMISAHMHRQMFFPALKGVHDFPIVVNDNVSAMLVKSSDQGVDVKITNRNGKVTFEERF